MTSKESQVMKAFINILNGRQIINTNKGKGFYRWVSVPNITHHCQVDAKTIEDVMEKRGIERSGRCFSPKEYEGFIKDEDYFLIKS